MGWRPITLAVLALGMALAQVVPGDFAATIAIEPSGDSPLQVVILPPEVYQATHRSNLADVRVFNAGGEEVPVAHLKPGPSREPERQRVELPFFTLEDEAEISEDLRVRIETRGSGATVTLDSQPGAAPTPTPKAYLIDAGELPGDLAALQLEWDAASRDFVTTVAVETSSDLASWRRRGDSTVIAQLNQGGSSLQRNLITLPASSEPFLRLVRITGDPLPRLSQIGGEVVGEGSEPELLRFEAQAEPAAEPHVYRFDSGGLFPVVQLRFELPQENTLAQAQVHSAPTSEGPWSRRFQGLLYRLRRGEQSIASGAIDLNLTSHRYWRLTVDPSGGGLGSGQPVLELGYAPERLLFVARGEAPFVLAYGNPTVSAGTFTAADLLAFLPSDVLLEALPPAQLGSVIRPGAPPPAAPQEVAWQRILLWSTLLVGVAALGWMATRLIRAMASSAVSAPQSTDPER